MKDVTWWRVAILVITAVVSYVILNHLNKKGYFKVIEDKKEEEQDEKES